MHRAYIDAGFRVMALHPILAGGKCGCGNPKCTMAGKHPTAKGWESTPDWSDEQLETMEALGHFRGGFGVLCDGHLVIDVDARNGGVESLAKLHKDVPELAACGFVVETGSGGGSRHFYFHLSSSLALQTKLDAYPGIDFKSSGYVVGAGSRHKSGKRYAAVVGEPLDTTLAPESLLELLKRPERHRTHDNDGGVLDISDNELSEMLAHIDPDVSYEVWVRIGMAVHHVTNGAGIDIWGAWSARGQKYDGPQSIAHHWHSFGKCANPVTFGTLAHHAQQGGWVQPVTFEPGVEFDIVPAQPVSDLWDESNIDLLRPPGFCGVIAEWINNQCRYPRERLAAAASLWTVGSVAGLRMIDGRDGVTTNLMVFGIAGSGTGKESILQSVQSLIQAANLHPALHGSIKSEQEIVRNLISHQAALYAIDEFGIFLSKITNSQKAGGASYLQGVIGMLMGAYSKASGTFLLTGDQKRELKKEQAQKIAALEKNPDTTEDELRHERLMLDQIEQGLSRPMLSLIGFTTPGTFDHLMTRDQAQNGFLARALLVEEPETNPRHKKDYRRRPPMDEAIMRRLQLMASGGSYDTRRTRIECTDNPHELPTDRDADELLCRYADEFLDLAEQQKNAGMEPVMRRAFETGLKISTILAVADGVRTTQHVRWGMLMARRDAESKIRKALANDHVGNNDTKTNALLARILELSDPDGGGMTIARLANRMPRYKRDDIAKAVEVLVTSGSLSAKPASGRNLKDGGMRYFRADGAVDLEGAAVLH